MILDDNLKPFTCLLSRGTPNQIVVNYGCVLGAGNDKRIDQMFVPKNGNSSLVRQSHRNFLTRNSIPLVGAGDFGHYVIYLEMIIEDPEQTLKTIGEKYDKFVTERHETSFMEYTTQTHSRQQMFEKYGVSHDAELLTVPHKQYGNPLNEDMMPLLNWTPAITEVKVGVEGISDVDKYFFIKNQEGFSKKVPIAHVSLAKGKVHQIINSDYVFVHPFYYLEKLKTEFIYKEEEE